METTLYLNRYRLSLGRNGLPVELQRTPHGITYRAQEVASGREVSIELIPWTQGLDAAAVDRVETEATAARQIRHINIPALLDFGIENDQLIYVTDYLEGHTAEAWVAARGPLPLPAVLRIAIQVVGALGAAKFHRLTHRAICPANILFVPGQTAEGDWPAIKVLHWLGLPPNGLTSESADARADALARFASPEQGRGGEVDFAAAVYSLGCTMWFLLTGVAPDAGPLLNEARKLPVEKLRGVPKIVRHLLGRMLRVEPAERPQDPVALEAFLQTCLARVERRAAVTRRMGVPVVAQARVASTRALRDLPIKPLAIAAVLLLCATLAAVTLPRMLRARKQTQAGAAVVRQTPQDYTSTQTFAPKVGAVPNEPVLAPTPAALPSAQPEETAIALAKNEPAPETSEVVRQEPAREEANEAEPPAPAPAEGPETTVAETATDAESPAEPTPTIAAVAEAEPPPPEISPTLPPGAEPPKLASNFQEPPQPTPAAHAKVVAAVTPRPAKNSRHHSAAAKTASARTRSHSRVAQHSVRRGRKIPQLRVGSDRAELVGTTSDGRWILSVASSGERVIVPPPPGFSP